MEYSEPRHGAVPHSAAALIVEAEQLAGATIEIDRDLVARIKITVCPSGQHHADRRCVGRWQSQPRHLAVRDQCLGARHENVVRYILTGSTTGRHGWSDSRQRQDGTDSISERAREAKIQP